MKRILFPHGNTSGINDVGKLYIVSLITLKYTCRPQYAQLSQLSVLFPNLPLMALTATAPPAVLDEIHCVIPRPFIVRASVNQPNVTYRVIKQIRDGKGNQTSLSKFIYPQHAYGGQCTAEHRNYITIGYIGDR
jgi:superfamily II DNA helicase RecQ